jgi:DnaJ-class molecular chaperone
MTSTRCEFCAGSGRAPEAYVHTCCQFCGGRGWIVDPAPAASLPNLTLTTQETA